MQLADTIGANQTLVGGSIKSTPIARPDSTNAIGNTLLTVAAPGVLANDSDPDGDTVSVSASSPTSANGGTVAVNANGSFTYISAAGFTGTDTFTYTISDGNGGTSSSTVTVTVSERVWYVNNAGPNGDGRQTSPFNSLTGAGTASAANDYIYVFQGSGNYTAGITLKNTQKLVGSGDALVVGSTTIFAAGTRPNILVASTAVTLATDNIVHGLDIRSSNGRAISGASAGSLVISNVIASATAGAAVNIASGTVAVTLDSASSTNSPDNGIVLSSINGSFVANGGFIRDAAGTDFSVTAGNGTVSYAGGFNNSVGRSVDISGRTGGTVTLSGNITDTGTGISVSGCSGGTTTFSGTTKTLNTSANTAVSLTSNNGHTINFSGGGLDIDTTTGTGFNATGGGTINVTGTGNSINSVSATALNVANTTIGGTGFTFHDISAGNNTAAADPVNGIVLNNTGSSGHLTVTGDGNTSVGGNSSGGTIQHTTNYGISLTGTLSPSFTNLNIHDIARNGIDGFGVTNFTFANSTVTNTGTALVPGDFEQNGIAFVDRTTPNPTGSSVSGNVSITGSTITDPERYGVLIQNWSGTISNLNISNNTLSGGTTTANIQSAILVKADGSASTTANITTGTIQNNIISGFRFFDVANNFYIGGSGIFIAGGTTGNSSTAATLGTAAAPIVISGNDIDNVGDSFIKVTFNGRLGVSNFTISNNGTVANPMTNAEGVGLSVFFGGNPNTANADNFKAVVDHNVLDLNNRAGSSGLAVQMDNGGNTADAPKVSFDINNNTIKHEAGSGIVAIGINDAGTMFVKVNDNHVLDKPTSSAGYGIRISENSVGPIINLEMHGNDTVGGGVFTAGGIGLRKAGSTQFGIEGLPAGSENSPGPENYVNSQNPAAGGTELISATTGFSNQNVP